MALSPIQARRIRRHREIVWYEPCELERESFEWEWLPGRRDQVRVTVFVCACREGGYPRGLCPYPARMCRPKLCQEGRA